MHQISSKKNRKQKRKEKILRYNILWKTRYRCLTKSLQIEQPFGQRQGTCVQSQLRNRKKNVGVLLCTGKCLILINVFPISLPSTALSYSLAQRDKTVNHQVQNINFFSYLVDKHFLPLHFLLFYAAMLRASSSTLYKHTYTKLKISKKLYQEKEQSEIIIQNIAWFTECVVRRKK